MAAATAFCCSGLALGVTIWTTDAAGFAGASGGAGLLLKLTTTEGAGGGACACVDGAAFAAGVGEVGGTLLVELFGAGDAIGGGAGLALLFVTGAGAGAVKTGCRFPERAGRLLPARQTVMC